MSEHDSSAFSATSHTPEQVADTCHEVHDSGSGILGHAGSYWMAQREDGIGPVSVADVTVSADMWAARCGD